MGRTLGLAGLVTDQSAAPPSRHAPQPMTKEMEAILADVPLFAGLSRRHVHRISGLATTKWFPRGATLVKTGAPAESFFVILNGRARVRAGSRRLTIGSGEFFGEMSLIDGDPRSATVTAETDCLVMMLPRRRFLKLVESEPKVALAIMTTLSRRVRSLQAASVV